MSFRPANKSCVLLACGLLLGLLATPLFVHPSMAEDATGRRRCSEACAASHARLRGSRRRHPRER